MLFAFVLSAGLPLTPEMTFDGKSGDATVTWDSDVVSD